MSGRGATRLAVALAALLLATAPARTQPQPLLPVQHLRVGDIMRTYRLQRFRAAAARGPLPIVIFLPGIGTRVDRPIRPRYDLRFDQVAGMPPALLVTVQGVRGVWDSMPASFDAGPRLTDSAGHRARDIEFLRALISHLVVREHGDPRRVYAAGVSAGGFMVPRIACEMTDAVAAAADLLATARVREFQACAREKPIPFLLLASTTDPVDPYRGHASFYLGHKAGPDYLIASAPDTAWFFAGRDRCTGYREAALAHRDPALHSTVSLMRFTGCAPGSEVLFYRVDGSGHSVPATRPISPAGWDASGRRNRDIDAATVLWRFFSRHQLPAAPLRVASP